MMRSLQSQMVSRYEVRANASRSMDSDFEGAFARIRAEVLSSWPIHGSANFASDASDRDGAGFPTVADIACQDDVPLLGCSANDVGFGQDVGADQVGEALDQGVRPCARIMPFPDAIGGPAAYKLQADVGAQSAAESFGDFPRGDDQDADVAFRPGVAAGPVDRAASDGLAQDGIPTRHDLLDRLGQFHGGVHSLASARTGLFDLHEDTPTAPELDGTLQGRQARTQPPDSPGYGKAVRAGRGTHTPNDLAESVGRKP